MRKGLFALTVVAATFAGSTITTTTEASDHVDGIQTAIDIAADVTDVYSFTSPADANKLVLVMNVHGLAFSRSRFSNAVDYKIRIRPIEDAQKLVPSADPRKEQSVTCTFSGGVLIVNAKQRATCTYNFGGGTETVTFDTRGNNDYKAGGEGRSASTHVFAGVRSDTWFLDLGKTIKWNKAQPVPATGGTNGLSGHNILSIVVEIDKSKLPGTLLAITGQTVRK